VEPESIDIRERAVSREGAGGEERAASCESAETAERAGDSESAETVEQPRYSLGFPRIESPAHHLWDAQQSGWPDHLPQEAWASLVRAYNKQKVRGDSADLPSFQQGYAPNYAATPDGPSEAATTPRHGERQRR
jgi:hypothetical protein